MALAIHLLVPGYRIFHCPPGHGHLLPETCRSVVGNGSIPVPPWNKAIFPILRPRAPDLPPENSQQKRETHTKFGNPFSGLALLRHRATLVVSVCFGIYYMVHTCLQASLSTIFVQVYGVSGLVAGLVYIPFGVGCMVSSFIAGLKPLCIVLCPTGHFNN